MNIEWQKYRTIEAYGYHRRVLIAGAITFLIFVFCWSYPVLFGGHKWAELFTGGGISVSPILFAGLFCVFLLFLFYSRRVTKNRPCPQCGHRCEEHESNGSGQLYLVCHDCKLKWDSGLNNANGL